MTQYMIGAISGFIGGFLVGYSYWAKKSNKGEVMAKLLEQKLKDFDDKLQNSNKTIGEFKNSITEQVAQKMQAISQATQESSKQTREGLNEQIKIITNLTSQQFHEKIDAITKLMQEAQGQSGKQFKDMLEGHIKLVEGVQAGQAHINNLAKEVTKVNHLLGGKGIQRGQLGEIHLDAVLKRVFEDNTDFYSTQEEIMHEGQRLRPDAIIKLPEAIGHICIDVKNYFDSYNKLEEAIANLEDAELKDSKPLIETCKKAVESARKAFNKDLWDNVITVSTKYIIPGKTAKFAILLIPFESMFKEIPTKAHEEAILKNVFIASPTNLLHICHTANSICRQARWDKEANQIREDLLLLAKDFSMYVERWKGLNDYVNNAYDGIKKRMQEVSITSNKISNKFNLIQNRSATPSLPLAETKQELQIEIKETNA